MQPDDRESIDKQKQLAKQKDTIKNVVNWLKEEGLDPQEITHLRKDLTYYGVVISNHDEDNTGNREKEERRDAFHILFPIDKPDSLTISEIIILDLKSQKSYASLLTKPNGVSEQNKFYFNLKLALLQMNVDFVIKKDIRQLLSLEIHKVIFFDGLTKDTLFNTINTVHHSIEIVRIKTAELRDMVFP